LKRVHSELDTKIHQTTHAVIEFVLDNFGLKYSPSGMRDLLHREGYTFKKPKWVPGNPDAEALFIDAVHPEHNAMAGYGWIKKGETRQLKTNSGRQRLNLHGAINAETMEMTLIESETINRDSTVQLLEILDRKYFYAKEIIVILDNAKYHYSEEVRKVIEKSVVQ